MEIFHTFGINLYLFVAEVINFLLILYILKRFLYKPLFKLLKKRKDAIEQGLLDSDQAKKLLEKATNEEAVIIKKANKRSEEILADAKVEAFEIIQSAQNEAKKKSKILIDEAYEQIVQEQKRIEKKIFTKLSKVMASFLEKSTDELFDEKMQKMLIKNALTKFKKEQTNI